MNRNSRGISIYVITLAIVVLLIYSLRGQFTVREEYTYQQFEEAVEESKVARVDIEQNEQVPTGKLTILFTDGSTKTLNVSDVKEVQAFLEDTDIVTYLADVPAGNTLLGSIIPVLIVCAFMFVMMMLVNRQSNGVSSKMMNFGKSRATMVMPDAKRVMFKDVAGLQEEKEDLEELVDFLREPEKYTQMGARIPKGVILVGPPGTGKTLLAKAVAGEAGVPFFSISGSDFVEMYVGVGASRVRDLFEDAKKHAPCIVFIDEIDAVARRRGTGMGGGHDEREQTLNQLLVEMDGFGVNEGIIVMAATNRVDILDPAILRPGRFDRKIGVGKPDVKGREEILKVHAKGKSMSDDVDLENVARTTAGFTGADLENLLNEAAILAARRKRPCIVQTDINDSFVKVGIGTEKKSRLISEREKRITAYHEAGHALLFHLLPNVESVHTISIIPTGMGAAGYTMPLPEKDEMFLTKGKILDTLVVDLGGRVAEELVLGDVTTGASQDIKQATQLARAMVTRYGMSERVGLIDYGSDENEVFIGRDLAQSRGFSDSMAAVIDEEVKRIMDEAHEKATKLIKGNMEFLHRCAQLLVEKEKIGKEEFESIFVQSA